VIYRMSTSIEIPFQDVSPRLINMLVGGIVSGEVGYQAYGDSVGWKNYLGRPMPTWAELPEAIQVAWNRAAYAIVDAAYRKGTEYAAVDAACQVDEQHGPGEICECGHSSHHHDVAEADGSGQRCCVDGCGCSGGQ